VLCDTGGGRPKTFSGAKNNLASGKINRVDMNSELYPN
jgi:hypothetical protein